MINLIQKTQVDVTLCLETSAIIDSFSKNSILRIASYSIKCFLLYKLQIMTYLQTI